MRIGGCECRWGRFKLRVQTCFIIVASSAFRDRYPALPNTFLLETHELVFNELNAKNNDKGEAAAGVLESLARLYRLPPRSEGWSRCGSDLRSGIIL